MSFKLSHDEENSAFIALITLLSWILPARAQYLAPAEKTFTRQDTLRGSITPERAWWDLTYYHLIFQ
jgi:hypothetical protein